MQTREKPILWCRGLGPPREPCPFSQRNISTSPLHTPPKLGGSPQSQPFFQPSFSNQAKLSAIFETLRIGVRRLTFIVLPTSVKDIQLRLMISRQVAT